MGGIGKLNIHRIDTFDNIEKTIIHPDCIKIANALVTSKVSSELFKELKANSEHSIMVVPFSDGPVGAILTMIETIKKASYFDNITPVYLDMAADCSKARTLCHLKNDISLVPEGAFPFSATFDGGRGEILLNSARSLLGLSKTKEQAAINVRIQTSRIPFLQTTIESFENLNYLDFGYFGEPNPSPYRLVKPVEYPYDWNLGNTDLEKRVPAFVKQLLSQSGYFSGFDSPLRSVEIIRSQIIGHLKQNKNGLSYRQIDTYLSPIYDKSYGLNLPTSQQKQLNYRLVESLVESGVVSKIWVDRLGRDNLVFIDGSPNKDLIQSYFDYYMSEC